MILLAAASGAAEQTSAPGPWLMIGIAIVLTAVAIALFFLEAFFPSMGLITIMGLACIGGALIAAFSVSRIVGCIFIAVTVLAIPLTVIMAVRLLKGAGAVLQEKTGPAEAGGGTGAPAEPALAPGARGVVLTRLRPAGMAAFGGRRVSVVTTGEMVEPDEQVEVVRVVGTRTVVRPVKAG